MQKLKIPENWPFYGIIKNVKGPQNRFDLGIFPYFKRCPYLVNDIPEKRKPPLLGVIRGVGGRGEGGTRRFPEIAPA